MHEVAVALHEDRHSAKGLARASYVLKDLERICYIDEFPRKLIYSLDTGVNKEG
jgi:hypothetical protein